MNEWHVKSSIFTTLLAITLAMPSLATAQDNEMNFELEEAEGGNGDGNEMTFEEEGGDGGEMSFDVGEVVDAPPTEGPKLASVILLTEDGLDPALIPVLTKALNAEIAKLQSFQLLPSTSLEGKFNAMGKQGGLDCAFNPICLARVGTELEAEYLLIARVSGSQGNYGLNIDLINVANASVDDYVSRTIRGDQNELKLVLQESTPKVFGVHIRKSRERPVAEAKGPSETQKILAYSFGGLAVVSLGAGLYFGLDASSQQDDLESKTKALQITQKEAESLTTEAQDTAFLANVMYGVGIASAVGSALLFLITPGEDIASEEELQDKRTISWDLAPGLSPDGRGAGVNALFTW